MMIPAFTVWQPWASLIAWGVKTTETRSRAAPQKLIGKRIAIHAAKRPANLRGLNWHTKDHLDQRCTGSSRCTKIGAYWVCSGQCLPHGAIIATAVLAQVGKVECLSRKGWHGTMEIILPPRPAWLKRRMGRDMRMFKSDIYGDYSVGQRLWFLTDIEPVDPPILATGRQGFWNFETV